MSKKHKNPKDGCEEKFDYEEYLCDLYDFEVIVDYTPGGFPIGIKRNEISGNSEKTVQKSDNDDLPF